jgi:transposase-like protein
MPNAQPRPPKPRRRCWSVAEARAVLSAQAASGLSVGAFARREGLDDERLYRWQRRLAREGKSEARAAPATPPLLELRPPASLRLATSAAVEIVLASGVTLRVAETIESAVLVRLVTALRGC